MRFDFSYLMFALPFFFDMLPAMAVTAPLYLLCRKAYLRRAWRESSRARETLLFVFVLYLAGLASQTILPDFVLSNGQLHIYNGFARSAVERLQSGHGVNFIPFLTLRSQLAHLSSDRYHTIFAINLIGNVVCFVPFGFFLPQLWLRLRRFWIVFAAGLLLTCSIEVIQLFIGRSTDVDDVILNVTGVSLGFFLYLLVRAIARKRSRRKA